VLLFYCSHHLAPAAESTRCRVQYTICSYFQQYSKQSEWNSLTVFPSIHKTIWITHLLQKHSSLFIILQYSELNSTRLVGWWQVVLAWWDESPGAGEWGFGAGDSGRCLPSKRCMGVVVLGGNFSLFYVIILITLVIIFRLYYPHGHVVLLRIPISSKWRCP
jgi:hypothetical protein